MSPSQGSLPIILIQPVNLAIFLLNELPLLALIKMVINAFY